MFAKKSDQPSAKVVEGNLIISLPNAKNPIVWRMALGEAKSSALEVREQNNDHVLILKNPKGDVTEIAPFAQKQDATDALMSIAKAMQESHGQLRAQDHIAPARSIRGTGDSWKWLIPLAVIILALFLYTRTAAIVPVDYSTATAGATTTGPATNTTDTGVPLSADQFLSGM